MKNVMLKKLFTALFFSMTAVHFTIGCVDTVNDPSGGISTSGSIQIEILYPKQRDSIRMGKNIVVYNAVDVVNGPGLTAFELFAGTPSVTAKSIQMFYVVNDGINPEVYIHTDSLEKKLGLDPYSFPSRINFWITAYNKNNSFKASKVNDSVFVDRRPAKPLNLTITRITETSFTLFWDDVARNEQSYEIWRKDGINSGYFKVTTLPANNFSKMEFVSSAYVTYFYKVRAVNDFGASDFSNEVNSSGVEGGNTPSNLVAEALGASIVRLTWKDNSTDEIGFRIQRTNPVTGEFGQVAITASNVTEYIDQGLSAATTYKYRLASFTSSSQSAWSNEATVVTYNIDIPPPGSLKASFKTDERYVLVSWNDNTNLENGTLIERKEGLTGTYEEIGAAGTDQRSFIDQNIETDKLYTYRARHTTVEGFRTQYSNEDTVYVPVLKPVAPSNLRISEFTPGYLYGLVWQDNSDDETGFELLRTAEPGGETKTYQFAPNTVAFNDTIPDPNKIYYYKVRAVKGSLYSDYSNEVSSTGSTGSIAAPTNLQAAQVTGQAAVQLTWQDTSTDELGFIVERKMYGSLVFIELGRVGPNTASYIDSNSGLVMGNAYVYRVKAYGAQTESDYSNEATVVIISP